MVWVRGSIFDVHNSTARLQRGVAQGHYVAYTTIAIPFSANSQTINCFTATIWSPLIFTLRLCLLCITANATKSLFRETLAFWSEIPGNQLNSSSRVVTSTWGVIPANVINLPLSSSWSPPPTSPSSSVTLIDSTDAAERLTELSGRH